MGSATLPLLTSLGEKATRRSEKERKKERKTYPLGKMSEAKYENWSTHTDTDTQTHRHTHTETHTDTHTHTHTHLSLIHI